MVTTQENVLVTVPLLLDTKEWQRTHCNEFHVENDYLTALCTGEMRVVQIKNVPLAIVA
jgi:hypothetical protein